MKRILASAMTFCLAAAALAQEAGKTAAPAGKPNPLTGPAGILGNPLFMIAIIIFMFYFMILRPQKTEQRKREELLSSVAKGDSVVTTSGIYGTVESVDTAKGIVTVNVAPKVSIKFSRAAISSIEKKRGGKEEAETSAS